MTTGPNATPAPAVNRTRPTTATPHFPIMRWLGMHWLAILFFGALIGSFLAALAWNVVPAKVESYALLRVASAPSYVANHNDPLKAKTDFTTALKTTAMLIKSYNVLVNALNNEEYGVANLDIVKNARDPIAFLDEQVIVTFQEGNEIIRISAKVENGEDARSMVDAIQKAYMKVVVGGESSEKKKLLKDVEDAKVALTKSINDKTIKANPDTAVAANPPQPLPGSVVSSNTTVIPVVNTNEVKQVNAVVPPAPVIGESFRRAVADQLLKKIAEYEDQLAYLPGVIHDRERKRDQVKKSIEKALTEPANADALAAAEKDQEVVTLRFEAKRARADYEHYKSLSSNPNAPSVVAFQERAKALEDQADQRRAVKAKEIEASRRIAAGSQYDQQLLDAERELARLKEQADVAVVLRDRAKEELNKLPPEVLKDEVKGPVVDPSKTDLVAHNVLLDRVTQQEIGLGFEINSPRVKVEQVASAAMMRDMKKQIIATVAAGLFGFALAGLVTVGYEVKTRKVSALAELSIASNVPCVSVIPHSPTANTFRDPLKRIDVIEAVDKLRTYVTQNWLPKGAKTIAVTSPLGDEGKTMVACHLAESLARAGVRTLLVDFDLRSPAVHKLERLENKRGACELLRDEVQPGDAVVGMPNGLYVLTAGNWTDETRHFAAGERIKSLFGVLSQPFECVIVHGHSLLTTAESVEVARRVDAVLLCTQFRESRTPLVSRAAERLNKMNVANMGMVYVGATPHEALC